MSERKREGMWPGLGKGEAGIFLYSPLIAWGRQYGKKGYQAVKERVIGVYKKKQILSSRRYLAQGTWLGTLWTTESREERKKKSC